MSPFRSERDAGGILAAIIESAVDAIVVIDDRGLIELFNPAAERLFGYAEAEVVGRNVSMLMPSPYAEEHDAYLQRYLSTGEARIIGIGREVRGLRRDGTMFPLHLSVGEMAIKGGRKFTGILHDLSSRIELEERLRTSEARWRTIVQSAVDGIVVINARGRIEAFNPAAVRLFGYTEAEAIGQNVSMLMPSPYHEEHDEYIARYLRTGEPRIIGIGREVTGKRRDGSTFPVHLSVGEMVLSGERKFTGILHDLSRRLAMEESLRERTAMARLGEMAAVIAHEVKNPLAGIRGAMQVIGGRLPSGSRDAAIVKEVVTRIDTLNMLVGDLLLFARPPQPKFSSVDLAALVKMTAELISNDPASSGVQINVEGSKPTITADPEMLKIVFHNLLVNSTQAMHGRGVIDVSIETRDDVCRVEVRDNGPGIPPDIRDRIFTPFFTTKSRGTGLGLPTAKRLIEVHSGTMAIDGPAGGGTTVVIHFPIWTDGPGGDSRR